MSWDWAGVSSIRIMGNARRMIAKPTVYRAFFFTKLDDGEYTSDAELNNPHASDFDSKVLDFTNDTGKNVDSVETSSDFVEVVSSTLSSVTIKAKTSGATSAGLSINDVSFTFKDSEGQVITSASASVGVKKTVKYDAKQFIEGLTFGGEISATVNSAFTTSANGIAFDDPNAASYVGLTAVQAIEFGPFEGEIKASGKAAIDAISDNFSLEYSLGASVSYGTKEVGGIDWKLTGAWKEAFSSEGSYSQGASGEVSILSVDSV